MVPAWNIHGFLVILIGGEWDYIIFSLVRSLPDFRIEKCPTLGWCSQNLGFITDKHQINVALTRAKKGLFLIGKISSLTHGVWPILTDTHATVFWVKIIASNICIFYLQSRYFLSLDIQYLFNITYNWGIWTVLCIFQV